MIINSHESFCNGDEMPFSENVMEIGSMERTNTFIDINSANNHNISGHAEESIRKADCGSMYSTFSPCLTTLQQQQQLYSNCYEKQRNSMSSSMMTSSYRDNVQVSTLLHSSSVSPLSSSPVPSSPVTIVSVPSPADHKSGQEDLEIFRRQQHMHQVNALPSPPSSSPDIESHGYCDHSPQCAYNFRSNQSETILRNTNCFTDQTFPQHHLHPNASVQSQMTDLHSYTQRSCIVAGTTTAEFLPSEVNVNRFEQASNHPEFVLQGNGPVSMPRHSHLVESIEFGPLNQQMNGASPSSSGSERESNNLMEDGTDLTDEQLMNMTVRDLNKWIRGMRYIVNFFFN